MIVTDIGKTEEGPHRVHRDHHLAGEPAEAAADQGGEPAAGAGREPHRRAGARAGARRQDRRVDRRRPARDRSARRAAADRDDLPAQHQVRSRDAADPQRRRHPLHAGQPRRHGAGVELVHARGRREAAIDQRHPAALPEIHRPRRQPRLLHDEHVGERQREPDDVSRVVPGDHVQPSSDRPGRRGAVRAAVPRSVQLQLRSADPARHRHGRRRDSHAARRGRQAGRGDADRRALLDLVQRRHPHDVVLPQPDRHPDRDDRQPDAGRDSVRARHAAAARRRAEPDRAAAPSTSARRSSTRSPTTTAILDIASKRHEDFLYNMYKMAKNAIDKGNRDNWTIHPKRIEAAREAIEAAQAGASRGGENIGPRGGARRRRRRAAARRSRSTTTSSTIRRCAIRAASSCRRISPTS